MSKTLAMVLATLPFHLVATYGIVLSASQFGNAVVGAAEWAFLFCMGVAVPLLATVYLLREMGSGPSDGRVRWMAVWLGTLTPIAVIIAVHLLRRALTG